MIKTRYLLAIAIEGDGERMWLQCYGWGPYSSERTDSRAQELYDEHKGYLYVWECTRPPPMEEASKAIRDQVSLATFPWAVRVIHDKRRHGVPS